MKKVFRESFIGHELCNKQSLFSLAATPNQVSQSFIPELPHSTCLLLKGPTKQDTKIRHKIPLTPHWAKKKSKNQKQWHELGIVENQAKQTYWSASQPPSYRPQASLCRQHLELSHRVPRQCCLVRILRWQLWADPNCTHWTLPKDPSHSSSHHHLYPQIKNKNKVSIKIKNTSLVLFVCPQWSGKAKSPLSDKSWRFDLTWEGHQQRENLEQRAPIGESAITATVRARERVRTTATATTLTTLDVSV